MFSGNILIFKLCVLSKMRKIFDQKSCLLKALLVSYFKGKIENIYEGCSYLPVQSVLINKII